MKYGFAILGATLLAGCGPQTDVVAYGSAPLNQADSGLDAGGDSGATGSGIACTPSTDALIFIYKADGGLTLFNTSNGTFKDGGSARCVLGGVTGMAVQSDATLWLADGTGRLWTWPQNGLGCTATSLVFPPPVILTFTTLPGKPWEALYAATGDHRLVGIDPQTSAQAPIGSFDANGPPLVGLTGRWDTTLRGLANLGTPTAEILTYDITGALQSKTDFQVSAGPGAIGFGAAGSSLYVFSVKSVDQFDLLQGKVVASSFVPIDGAVAIASSPCSSSPNASR